MTREAPTTPNSLAALHRRQLAWKPLPRLLWWVILLPVATACWAASQARAPKQAAGWVLAGLALLSYVSLAVGAASPKATTRSSSGAGAAVLAEPPPSPSFASPTETATPEPTPTTELVTAAPTTEAPAPVATTPAPAAAPVSPRSVPTHVQVAAPPAVPVAPVAPVAPAAPAAQSFANCVALNAVYPHGVARPGAVDHVSGSTAPVTDFQVDAAVYAANTGRDGDGDGVACERH
jgi:hypothetical protein